MTAEEIVEHYGFAALDKLAELVGASRPEDIRPAIEKLTRGDDKMKRWLLVQAFERVVPAHHWRNRT